MHAKQLLPYAAVLLALSGVAACAEGSTPAVTKRSVSAAPVRTIEISVKGSTVTPAPQQVELGAGQTLELIVTSDHDDALHAHGFEVEAQLKTGVPTALRLTGGEPGVYEVETHDPALTLLTVAVR